MAKTEHTLSSIATAPRGGMCTLAGKARVQNLEVSAKALEVKMQDAQR